MKQKAAEMERRRKKGFAILTPKLNENVLVRTPPMADAIKGMTSKFIYVFEGPYKITKLLDHSAYELKDESGNCGGNSTKINCD